MGAIRKEDSVKVIAGKDKGKTGKVLRILKKKQKLVIEGVNIYKKHEKPNPKNEKGGIVEKEFPIHISNVTLQSKTDSSISQSDKKEAEISKNKKTSSNKS